MPPERGLFVAALAPLAASFFASSPYLGTGPTAVTSLLTFGALAALASPGSSDYVALAALLALLVGAIRVALGLAGAGVVAYLMSQPVVLGFTSAAGIVIIASQVPAALGVGPGDENPFAAALRAIGDPGSWNGASILTVLTAATLVVGGRRLHPLFPGVLVAVAGAVVVSHMAGFDGPVVGAVDARFPPFTLGLPWGTAADLLLPAGVIAVVGFSEAASIARSYATLERKLWNPNREFVSQGVANLAAGLGGGFPAGGSFARSSLTRSAGARSKLAGGVSGLVVLALLPFTSLLSRLPVAVLSAVVIVAVVDLIKIRPFLEFRRYARVQFYIALATFVMTLAFVPRVEWAVVGGVALAIAAHLWRELRLSIPAWTEDEALHLEPKGVLYFASAPSVEQAFGDLLGRHRDARRLVLHLGGLGRVDLTGALVLRNLLDDAREAGLEVEVVDVPPHARKVIGRVLPDDVSG